MKPFLSIIIPTYNSSHTLCNTIDSITNQTYTNYEVLIIDNCSSDDTLRLAKEYALINPKIQTISEPDKGIYDAMNKGIKMAKGVWIYFLGSDDKLYNENVLSKIFTTIQTNSQKIVYGNVLINGDTGWAKDGQIYDGEFSLSKLIERNICHQAIFFNKIVFKRYGEYNLKFNICADWDMNLRIWSTYPFHYCETIIAVFKGGNSSYQIASNYNDIEKWLTIINSFKLKIILREFTQFHKSFLLLSRYYNEEGKYFKSFLFKMIFHLHKLRIHA